ncbi:HAD-IA family hydrolase [Phormidesmis priestleyi]
MNVVLFDFDGTIADSIETGIRVINRLAKEFGYQPIDLEALKRLQNLSSREIIKQTDISIFKLPFLLRRFVGEMRQEVQQIGVIPGMKEALQTLKTRGDRLGIVSTNSEENVRSFLETQQLDPLFDVVVCSGRPFGKSRLIKRILRQNQLDPRSVFYVGDETRDIEAAKKSGVRAIAVTWGFNSSQVLAAHQPDFLIQTPDQLLDILAWSVQP